jgi:hypothetical protein
VIKILYYQHLVVNKCELTEADIGLSGRGWRAADICSGDEGVEKFHMSELPSYAWYRSRSGSLGTSSLDVERPTSKNDSHVAPRIDCCQSPKYFTF